MKGQRANTDFLISHELKNEPNLDWERVIKK